MHPFVTERIKNLPYASVIETNPQMYAKVIRMAIPPKDNLLKNHMLIGLWPLIVRFSDIFYYLPD